MGEKDSIEVTRNNSAVEADFDCSDSIDDYEFV